MKLLITRIPGLSNKPYQDTVCFYSKGILKYQNKIENIDFELQEDQLREVEKLINYLDFEKMGKIIKKFGRTLDASKYRYEIEHKEGTCNIVEGPIFSFGRGHHLYKTVIVHFETIYNFLISLIDEQRFT